MVDGDGIKQSGRVPFFQGVEARRDVCHFEAPNDRYRCIGKYSSRSRNNL